MKGELININGTLGFFFKKNDVKTEMDKRELCMFIDRLYHYSSMMTWYKNEDIDDILHQAKKAYIGCFMDSDKQEVRFLNYSQKELEYAKEVASKLYELQEK